MSGISYYISTGGAAQQWEERKSSCYLSTAHVSIPHPSGGMTLVSLPQGTVHLLLQNVQISMKVFMKLSGITISTWGVQDRTARVGW